MNIHLARLMKYDELYIGLEFAAQEGMVRKYIGDDGLQLYCYTEKTVFERAWNDITILARGLILDTIKKEIVALPFIKFFNVGEDGTTIPDLPFQTFEKLDGSLIILFYHNGRWRCSTKGSLSSDQAKWAEHWIRDEDVDSWLVKGTTYLAEGIYPANRIVVHYDSEDTGLHLLAAYDGNGEELNYEKLKGVAAGLNWPVVHRHDYTHISELMAEALTLPKNREGFVIRFSNGLRLKIKGDEYCRIHRLVSRITPLAIWDMMQNEDDLATIRLQLPEEFWVDFDAIVENLQKKIDDITKRVRIWADRLGEKDDKAIGLMLKNIPRGYCQIHIPVP